MMVGVHQVGLICNFLTFHFICEKSRQTIILNGFADFYMKSKISKPGRVVASRPPGSVLSLISILI